MMQTALLTYEKRLASGSTVRIRNIPGTMKPGGERDPHAQFVTGMTAERIHALMRLARERAATGEREIDLDFSDGALTLATGPAPLG